MEEAMKCLTNAHFATKLVCECFDHQDSFRWFECCLQYFPSNLTIKLLEVYIDHVELRFKAMQLLSFLLSMTQLSEHVILDIKPLLLECLNQQFYRQLFEIELEFSFLKKMVSSVMDLVFENKLPCDELADCICGLAKSVPSLALFVFLHLPPSMGIGFINNIKFCNGIYNQLSLILTNSTSHRREDVVHAFASLMYRGVQLTGKNINADIRPLLITISDATRRLLDVGQTDMLCQALGRICSIVDKSLGQYGHYPSQKLFLFDATNTMIEVNLPMAVQRALFNMLRVLILL